MVLACCPDALHVALSRKKESGQSGTLHAKTVAAGEGWQAVDVVCTCGPRDGAAEEAHTRASVSVVLAGTFVCRSRHGSSLLAPGALFLGAAGETFQCSHEHGEGDRCLSFQFEPALFERIIEDTGMSRPSFGRDSLPPLRGLSAVVARAIAAAGSAEFEDVAYELAAAALKAAGPSKLPTPRANDRQRARVAEVVRHMESRIDERHTVSDLARLSGLSPYHFLRMFKAVTGVTPHQWLLRNRLRAAAERLTATRQRITDIALEVGFDDLSNFVRSFRAEFGVSPRRYRLAA